MTAVIVLFTYSRPDHTRRTVEALLRNELASESDLIVYSDAARTPEMQAAVDEVRAYLATISGFRSVTIKRRPINYGLAKSIIQGVTEVLQRSDRVIVLEDDMVTSPYFLKFMNEGLHRYRFEERVISIHGYIYPLKTQLPDTFFLKDTGCWGWATWKRGWDLFEPDGKILLRALEEKKLLKKFDINGSFPFSEMLRDQISGKNNSWAIRWQASAFVSDKLTLFPGQSLLQNIGHDSTGEHCTASNHFDVKLAEAPIAIQEISIEENSLVLRELEKYFQSIKIDLMSRILRKLTHIVRGFHKAVHDYRMG